MIHFIDRNKKLIERVQEIVKDCNFITAECGDIFEHAEKHDCMIATASNPSFTMGGGLDAEIARRFPDEVGKLREAVFTDNLFGLVTVGGDTRATDSTIKRAMAILYAYRYRKIAVTCIGTGIGGYSEDSFVQAVVNLCGADLRGVNLSGVDLSDADLSGANLSGVDLGGVNLSDANLRGVDLGYANLSGVNLCGVDLRYADLRGVNLGGVDLSGVNLRYADLSGANLCDANLCDANLCDANLSDANLRGVDLGYADLSGVNLSGVDLRYVDLRGVNLCGVDLRGVNLSGVDLSDANLCGANLCDANLCDANLCDANLGDANLRGVDLGYANLSDANLRGVDLGYADLRGVNLCGVDLRYADLSGANLRYANLCDVDLRYADLSGANLRGVDLRGVRFNERTAFYQLQCPSSGSFVGWKKCKDGVIVKLLIPARAKRSSATSRKCRAEYVKVLAVYGADEGVSAYDLSTIYHKGEIVRCDEWDDDRWSECSGGIHFFITREEAEQWNN